MRNNLRGVLNKGTQSSHDQYDNEAFHDFSLSETRFYLLRPDRVLPVVRVALGADRFATYWVSLRVLCLDRYGFP